MFFASNNTKGCHLVLFLQSFFSERFFSLFDTDGDGSIDMKELVNGLQILTKGTESEKLKFLFNVYDIDGKLCVLAICRSYKCHCIGLFNN